jgi:hypothetical protein
MAIALDASTPARWSAKDTTGVGAASAAFTAPSGAFLVVAVQHNTDGTTSAEAVTCSDSGGLTWTKQVERTAAEATAEGASAIFTAITVSAVSRTVTITPTWTGGGFFRVSAVCYVWTGVDVGGTPVDAITASNEGGSATNNFTTTSVTPGANGVLVASDCEWNELGAFQAPSDGSTQSTTTYAGEMSVCSAYRTCASGVGVTMNLNAGGTAAAQHKWCQIVVREVVVASGRVPYQPQYQQAPVMAQ